MMMDLLGSLMSVGYISAAGLLLGGPTILVYNLGVKSYRDKVNKDNQSRKDYVNKVHNRLDNIINDIKSQIPNQYPMDRVLVIYSIEIDGSVSRYSEYLDEIKSDHLYTDGRVFIDSVEYLPITGYDSQVLDINI